MKKFLILLLLILTLSLSSCNLGNLGNLIPGGTETNEDLLLKEVLPDSKKFEEIYDSQNPSSSSLTVLPDGFNYTGDSVNGTCGNVTSIYRETNGKGYVCYFYIVTNYSHMMSEFVIGVNNEAIVTGLKEVSYTESKPVGEDFLNSFVGKNVTLEDVSLVAGTTYSSIAIKTAVEQTIVLLIQNGLVERSCIEDYYYLDLVEKYFPDYRVGKELEGTSEIDKVYRTQNDNGFIFIVESNYHYRYLVISNNFGYSKVFVLNDSMDALVDVTSSYSYIASYGMEYAIDNRDIQTDRIYDLFKNMMEDQVYLIHGSMKNISTYNSTNYVVEIFMNSQTYYGFYSKQPGFREMEIFVVIDSEGKLYNVFTETLLFEEEYFEFVPGFNGIPFNYYQNMIGINQNDDVDALTQISGATLTSNAMAKAIKDAFETYNDMK